MIVLDTATWIWRASDPKRLTTSARRAIDEAERALVSAISVWEVAMLVAKRRIQLDRPVDRGEGLWVPVEGMKAHVARVMIPGQARIDGDGSIDGIEGFRTFSKQKAVFYQSGLNGMSLFNPPYGALFERLTKFLIR